MSDSKMREELKRSIYEVLSEFPDQPYTPVHKQLLRQMLACIDQPADVRGAEAVSYLPEITPDLWEQFNDTCLMTWHDGPQWTQTAVDFPVAVIGALQSPPQPAASVPDVGSQEMNEAAWKFIEALPEGEFRKAALSNPDIKPAIKAAADHLFSAATPQPAGDGIPYQSDYWAWEAGQWVHKGTCLVKYIGLSNVVIEIHGKRTVERSYLGGEIRFTPPQDQEKALNE